MLLTRCVGLHSISKPVQLLILFDFWPFSVYYILEREKNIRGLKAAKDRLLQIEAVLSRNEYITTKGIHWVGQGS